VGQDDLEEALVEARKLDSKLHAISHQQGEKPNVYKEDAFIRFVSGLLYEMGGKLDDAVVDYTKSQEIYRDYERNYGTRAPNFVIESLLSACDGAGFQERVAKYRGRFPGVRFLAYEDKRRLGEILVIHYDGRSPVKEPEKFRAEIDTGLVMDVAYPAYRPVPRSGNGAKVSATNAHSGQCQSFETETMENIEAIALRTHQNRIPWLQAKALARVKAQYILVREQTKAIRKEHGDEAAELFSSVAGSLKEMVDQADTRSWQSLPAEIRVGRALVPPGTYDVRANLRSGARVVQFDRFEVGPGQKKFLLLRSVE
jgi:hypothetical protein